ncbi:hypothetical protein [Mammaliicoccus lentus]|jgi:DeoR/GlpR family transcriptional regulator of sugar metabolism|uniref:hypothetical protein n=1 Tax=Mammaliicoccus lentus TaxID=42858 RepID=UPI0035191AE1
MDSEKFNRSSNFKGANLSDIDILITNKLPPEQILEKLKDIGVKVEIVNNKEWIGEL